MRRGACVAGVIVVFAASLVSCVGRSVSTLAAGSATRLGDRGRRDGPGSRGAQARRVRAAAVHAGGPAGTLPTGSRRQPELQHCERPRGIRVCRRRPLMRGSYFMAGGTGLSPRDREPRGRFARARGFHAPLQRGVGSRYLRVVRHRPRWPAGRLADRGASPAGSAAAPHGAASGACAAGMKYDRDLLLWDPDGGIGDGAGNELCTAQDLGGNRAHSRRSLMRWMMLLLTTEPRSTGVS